MIPKEELSTPKERRDSSRRRCSCLDFTQSISFSLSLIRKCRSSLNSGVPPNSMLMSASLLPAKSKGKSYLISTSPTTTMTHSSMELMEVYSTIHPIRLKNLTNQMGNTLRSKINPLWLDRPSKSICLRIIM